MTIQEIKAIQISNFLASKGYEPINRKGNKWWYLSPLHTEKTASFKVDLTKNVWYDFALGKGGNIIDLAMQLYHTQNISEVLHMMGHSIILPTIPIHSTCSQKDTSFEDIKVKELAHPALLQYLSGRGVDSITVPKGSAWKYTTKVLASDILLLASRMMLVAMNFGIHTSRDVLLRKQSLR